MRMKRLRRLLASFCLVLTACFAGNTVAQTRLAIEMPPMPRTDRFDNAPRKVEPELQPVLDANVTFLGVTKSGDAVVEVPAGLAVQEVVRFFLSTQRVAKVLPDNAEFEAVRGLAILVKDFSGDQEIAGLKVIGKHENGKLIFVETGGSVTPERLKALIVSENVNYVMIQRQGLHGYFFRD
jgi:hypothetical protein